MVTELTYNTRKELGMTLDKFAQAINEQMPEGVSLTAVHHWQTGRRKPDRNFFELMVRIYPEGDWRHDFAAAVIAELAGELEPTPSNSVPAESQN